MKRFLFIVAILINITVNVNAQVKTYTFNGATVKQHDYVLLTTQTINNNKVEFYIQLKSFVDKTLGDVSYKLILTTATYVDKYVDLSNPSEYRKYNLFSNEDQSVDFNSTVEGHTIFNASHDSETNHSMFMNNGVLYEVVNLPIMEWEFVALQLHMCDVMSFTSSNNTKYEFKLNSDSILYNQSKHFNLLPERYEESLRYYRKQYTFKGYNHK